MILLKYKLKDAKNTCMFLSLLKGMQLGKMESRMTTFKFRGMHM